MAAELALRAARWPSMTQRRLAVHVDAIVARADALRRQKKTQADRNLDWAAKTVSARSPAACCAPTPTP